MDAEISQVLSDVTSPIFVTHRHADRDALGAAIGLRELYGEGTICTPDGVAEPAQRLLEVTDTDPITVPPDTTDRSVFVLDAPSSERIAPMEVTEPILIDHHEQGDLADQALVRLIDDDAGATAELVVRIATEMDWELTPAAALPLAVGILDDTHHLCEAPASSVSAAGVVLEAVGERGEELPALIRQHITGGERTARALGIVRSDGYRAGDVLVATTRVGGYEGGTAETLRDNGVDLAVVLSAQDADLRVTVRSSASFSQRLSVGDDVLPALVAEFGGEGGGHEEAGTAHLDETSPEAVEAYLREWLSTELGVTFGNI